MDSLLAKTIHSFHNVIVIICFNLEMVVLGSEWEQINSIYSEAWGILWFLSALRKWLAK